MREEGKDEVSTSSTSWMCSPGWECLAHTHLCAHIGVAPVLSCCLRLVSFTPNKCPSSSHPILVVQKQGSHTNNILLCMCFPASVSLTFLLQLGVCCPNGGVLPAPLSIQPSFHPDLLISLLCALRYTGLQLHFSIPDLKHS